MEGPIDRTESRVETPPPRRTGRRRALGVGGMMLLIVPLAVWMGVVTNRARLQREAQAAILARGGWVTYDYQVAARKVRGGPQNPETPGPKWLRRVVGDEYFRSIVELSLCPRNATANAAKAEASPIDPQAEVAVLRLIARLPGVTFMTLGRAQATDAGLAQIENMNVVRAINLEDASDVTDAGMASLCNLENLDWLDIGEAPRVTDAGLAGLRRLIKLKHLAIAPAPQVTDVGLSHLAGLTNLTTLVINGSKVTGTGFVHLRGMDRLKTLVFAKGPVTSESLAHLSGLVNIDELVLGTSRITDGGLVHLKNLKKLKRLNLIMTPIAGPGLADLANLPRLKTILVGGDEFTDEGLVNLATLTQLEDVTILGPKLTDDGVANLESLVHMKKLGLAQMGQLTDRVFDHLRKFDNLESLRIVGSPDITSRITAEGPERLRGIPRLKGLMLANLAIDDPALAQLRRALPGINVVARRLGDPPAPVPTAAGPPPKNPAP